MVLKVIVINGNVLKKKPLKIPIQVKMLKQLKQKYGELLEENGKFKKSIKDLNDSHKKEISTRDFNDFLKREKDAWSKLY